MDAEHLRAVAPRILVLGIGGGGCNAVTRMVSAEVSGVEFVGLNTDQQALGRCRADRRVRLGEEDTRGLGAGGDPALGATATQQAGEQIRDLCRSADMVFVTAGMGGGTGTGGAPIVSQIAREVGALTVAVVTKPFAFEGVRRATTAEEGLQKLREHVHTLIVIPNDRVLQVIDKRTSMEMAFAVIDDVLRQCIQGISDLVTVPGLINLDFADVRTVMSESGSALMAVGSASGENRALEAARIAMSSPLLDLSMEGARGVLFNITGGPDLTLEEVHRAAEVIGRAAHPDANMIFGAVIDETMGDEIRMTVIATGFEPARRTDPRSRGGAWQLPPAASPPAPAEYAGVPDPSAPEDWLDLPPTLRRPRKPPEAGWEGRPVRPAWDTSGDPRQ